MIAHFVNVGGAKALLAAGQAPVGRRLLPHEEGLKWHHAGAGEQQGGVTGRYQRRARHVQVSLILEEFDEGISYLVPVHCPRPTR